MKCCLRSKKFTIRWTKRFSNQLMKAKQVSKHGVPSPFHSSTQNFSAVLPLFFQWLWNFYVFSAVNFDKPRCSLVSGQEAETFPYKDNFTTPINVEPRLHGTFSLTFLKQNGSFSEKSNKFPMSTSCGPKNSNCDLRMRFFFKIHFFQKSLRLEYRGVFFIQNLVCRTFFGSSKNDNFCCYDWKQRVA